MNNWPSEPTGSWELTPYAGDSQFKRQRLRHLDRIRQVVEHVRQHDYVVLLGPAYSEKTRLLNDVDEKLAASDLYTPIYVNLWRVRTDDEAAFFSSLAQVICRSERICGQPYADMERADRTYDGGSFRSFLDTIAQHHDRHVVLLIDHLQVLPQDLTHRLLQLFALPTWSASLLPNTRSTSSWREAPPWLNSRMTAPRPSTWRTPCFKGHSQLTLRWH